jgi:organic hydroperoxide reductase OsmC/OhrA
VSTHTHTYAITCAWHGSTALGYDNYDRTHTVDVADGTADTQVTLTSDPAFHGDPALLNPEELLVMAASSCQLLSFLAVAARARVDVIEYRDTADGTMPGDLRPMWITQIALHPRITVRGDVSEDRVRHLCEVAHSECFIANSVRTEITVEPTITIIPL